MAKVAKTIKAAPKVASKPSAKAVPKAAPAPKVEDDLLLAYAMYFGKDFLLFEKSAKGYNPSAMNRKQVLSEDGAHYIARQWPLKSLKVKVLKTTNFSWTVTNNQTGDVIEFEGKSLAVVQAKMVDTEGYRAWKTPLFPPCSAVASRMRIVREERNEADVKDRMATYAYPPAPGTKAAKALEAAKTCVEIARSIPVKKSKTWWKEWKTVELKTLEKYLKDSSLAVFHYDEELFEIRNFGSYDRLIATAKFCRADDMDNACVVESEFRFEKT